jgi:hypothetical protein
VPGSNEQPLLGERLESRVSLIYRWFENNGSNLSYTISGHSCALAME